MSVDAAGTSACATSLHANTCEKYGSPASFRAASKGGLQQRLAAPQLGKELVDR
jgi:hypothetical protein